MAKPRVTLACQHCGREFERDFNDRHQKFCAPACYHAHMMRPLEVRFWEHVKKLDGCWLWQGWIASNGYGRISVRRKSFPAHRISYELHYGAVPPDLIVCHKCDSPPCVRPDHLFLGTHADNAADRDRKGRHIAPAVSPEKRPRGERCHLSKLTEADVKAIRAQTAPGKRNMTALARKYGVGRIAIQSIVYGKTWKHIG